MEPKPQHLKLNAASRTEEGTVVRQEATTEQQGREFATPEEVLRFDAARTDVPAVIAQRLGQAVALETEPPAPWWRRWLLPRGTRS